MWNERYSAPGYAYGTEPNDFLAGSAAQIPRGRVLSLGDGEGRNGVFLATLGQAVTSVDASPVGLAKAHALAETRGVVIETITADLAEFVITPDAWEGIVSIFCHLPPSLRQRVHAQVVRGLVPGGVFVLEAYTPAQLALGTGGPSDPQMMPTLALLRDELAGLEMLHAVETERPVREGVFHDGRSAVVQVVARRPR
ncbi:MAG TPA: class I SAM-dependent methyltransferase [Gemmatimonadaceae bacterium]|jgi:SAM-dependent methyltransferase